MAYLHRQCASRRVICWRKWMMSGGGGGFFLVVEEFEWAMMNWAERTKNKRRGREKNNNE